MILYASNWKIEDDKNAFVGFSGENNTEDLWVIPQVMEDYTYTMELRTFDMSAFIPLEKVEYSGRMALHALLTAEQIGPAGKVEMQLVGRRTDSNGIHFKKKSNVFNAYVGDSINATQQFKNMPESAFEQYVTNAGQSADSAKESAAKAKQYLDSASKTVVPASIEESKEDGGTNTVTFGDGHKLQIMNGHTGAVGPQGEQGVQGPQGEKGDKGDTEFLTAVSGADASKVWRIMDEVMSTLKGLQPRMYEGILTKIAQSKQ